MNHFKEISIELFWRFWRHASLLDIWRKSHEKRFFIKKFLLNYFVDREEVHHFWTIFRKSHKKRICLSRVLLKYLGLAEKIFHYWTFLKSYIDNWSFRGQLYTADALILTKCNLLFNYERSHDLRRYQTNRMFCY